MEYQRIEGEVKMEELKGKIKKDVLDHLYWDQAVDEKGVSVDVVDGRVILKGHVSSYNARHEAEKDVSMIPGVREIDNRLEISIPDIVAEDDVIKARAESILAWSPELDSSKIQVYVENGWVTLTGSVDAYWKKERAEVLVSHVTDLTGIANQLAVTAHKDMADERIAADILSVLRRRGDIDISRIDVRVDDGYVTISGIAPSLMARESIGRMAGFTAGVKDVINDLRLPA